LIPEESDEMGEDKGREEGKRLTESVHLKPPQNMRESVVVMRRFLLRRDWR